MRYRKYGKTGLEVSEIGLGGHREGVDTRDGIARQARFFKSAQDRAAVVGRAIDKGITYFDTTYGCEIASLGESLRILGKRDGLFVSGMRVDFFNNLLRDELDVRAYIRREVEGRISDFGFDHIDQFILGAMEVGDPLSHPKSMMEDAIDEFGKLRDEGKVNYLGFSTHEPDYAARMLEAFPVFDAVMTPYNFMNRAAEGNLAQALTQTGAAWIVMKALVWKVYGIPVTAIKSLRRVSGKTEHDPTVSVARLALKFVLSNPLVCTTVPAMNSISEVDENLAASGLGQLTETETEQLEAYCAAMSVDDSIPLAIGGLMSKNGRVLAHAIGLIKWRLGIQTEEIDWEAVDAEERARAVAVHLLTRLADDPEWSRYW